ncbi:unnamed protein product [Thlaspi arvense]|uniref:Uncharacterized protein n=1 Tax=Thlaspi arvense TaxID=13288 RepID=A0AAU9R523_THLAR|nr:unnamed protein product [Thlaspi arvense]
MRLCSNAACRHTSPLCSLWSDGISRQKVCPTFPYFLSLSFNSSLICLNLKSGFLSTIPVHSFDRQFTADEVLQLLDRFYNLDMLKSDDEDSDILNHEEEFSLPQSYFDKEDKE